MKDRQVHSDAATRCGRSLAASRAANFLARALQKFVPAALLCIGIAGTPRSLARAAEFNVEVLLTNDTGEPKRDWPVILTVAGVFGRNLPLDEFHPNGFHVYGPDGSEIPHMRRPLPPGFSIGNDELIFILPRIAVGESVTVRIANTAKPGQTRTIDLATSAHNLIPNGGFESDAAGVPSGYKVISNKGLRIGFDPTTRREGKRSLHLSYPANSAGTLQLAEPIQFKRGVNYHFSIWARTRNMSYNGYGFGGAARVRFEPSALRGRKQIVLRDTRAWHCYKFDAGDRDSWGVPSSSSWAQTEWVRAGRRKQTPAPLWAKSGGKAFFTFGAWQQKQPFIAGNEPGHIWLDEAVLLEQPKVQVDRARKLSRLGTKPLWVFRRPINMPRTRVFPHELVERLNVFAMRGERRQLRFGVYAGKPLKGLRVSVSDLDGRQARIEKKHLILETLEAFVSHLRTRDAIAAGQSREFLLGIDVPDSARPGPYHGQILLSTETGVRKSVPLELTVLPMKVPQMNGYYVGAIYNIGMGMKRDDAFYREYGKTRFNYLMLFDYLFSTPAGKKQDWRAADAQVEKITRLARVTGGIGLYREPNMAEDQPRKWYQLASGAPRYAGAYKAGTDPRFKTQYQELVKLAEKHAKDRNWPTLVYMVADEPDKKQDVNESLGWINEAHPDAVTIADAQFHDMVKTWSWYNLPVFDDPCDWTGPQLYRWVRERKGRFGFCGSGWSLKGGRYQPGLMLAASGGIYWHFWHAKGPFAPRDGKIQRSHAIAAMSAGFNDLRYFVALQHAIEKARSRGRDATDASAYLRKVFGFVTADHDRYPPVPYNGLPEDWGDDRFYDRWRERMKDWIVRLDRP